MKSCGPAEVKQILLWPSCLDESSWVCLPFLICSSFLIFDRNLRDMSLILLQAYLLIVLFYCTSQRQGPPSISKKITTQFIAVLWK